MRTIQHSIFNSYFSKFFKALSKEDLSPITIKGYKQDLNAFDAWASEYFDRRTNIAKLSNIDIIAFRQHMIKVVRLNANTVNRRLEALRKFLKWAIRQKIIKNPTVLEVKTIKTVRNRRPLGLIESEVHSLLRAAGETKHGLAKRNYALVQLMVQAGLRVSEVAELQIRDIELKERSGNVRIQQGKGGKQREVPLNATARRAIRAYLNTRDGVKKNEPLFLSTEGGGISVRAIQTTMNSLGRRAKIKRVKATPHSLRHTFAISYLKENPGKIVELATLLGHDSLDTTAIYTRPSKDDLADDLEKSKFNIY
ncbi:MAG: tyrosine-type recombinase/integrase [Oligoflexia bacterium]|nr:tyrosine-type recombinase/integrase [Oligoflexia bacterium]